MIVDEAPRCPCCQGPLGEIFWGDFAEPPVPKPVSYGGGAIWVGEDGRTPDPFWECWSCRSRSSRSLEVRLVGRRGR